jgi:hypothetical protein
MSLRARVVSTFLILSLSSMACGGEPPTKEMQQAQEAIESARAAGADRYAAEQFAAAEEALQAANDAVAERDFRLALNHALDSRERAEIAADEASSKKADARIESQKALAEARAALTAADEQLGAAEKGRTPASVLAALRASWTTAEHHLQEAGTAFDAGDYMRADAETAAALQALSPVTTGLETAGPDASPRRR